MFDSHLIFDHSSLRFAWSRPILSLQKPLTPHTFGRFWKPQRIKFKHNHSPHAHRGFRKSCSLSKLLVMEFDCCQGNILSIRDG